MVSYSTILYLSKTGFSCCQCFKEHKLESTRVLCTTPVSDEPNQKLAATARQIGLVTRTQNYHNEKFSYEQTTEHTHTQALHVTRSLTAGKEHLTVGVGRSAAVAVGVGQHSLQALCGGHHARVGAVFTADFAVHSAEDLRRQMESVEDLVLPLMNRHAILTATSSSANQQASQRSPRVAQSARHSSIIW